MQRKALWAQSCIQAQFKFKVESKMIQSNTVLGLKPLLKLGPIYGERKKHLLTDRQTDRLGKQREKEAGCWESWEKKCCAPIVWKKGSGDLNPIQWRKERKKEKEKGDKRFVERKYFFPFIFCWVFNFFFVLLLPRCKRAKIERDGKVLASFSMWC